MGPEVLILAPRDLPLQRSREEGAVLARVQGLAETPAARWGQVHAVDARRYFSAEGPSLVRALEMLASLMHPALAWPEELLPGAASQPVAID